MKVAKSVASFRCGVPFIAATVEPPQFEETYSPAFHCGIFAARHLPTLAFIDEAISAGPQAAVGQEAYLPLSRPANHSLVQIGATSTALASISFCQ